MQDGAVPELWEGRGDPNHLQRARQSLDSLGLLIFSRISTRIGRGTHTTLHDAAE
jgi:hypothetical protein